MGGRAKLRSRQATGEQRGSSRACVYERSAKHASNGTAGLAARCPNRAKPPSCGFRAAKALLSGVARAHRAVSALVGLATGY